MGERLMFADWLQVLWAILAGVLFIATLLAVAPVMIAWWAIRALIRRVYSPARRERRRK